METGNLEIENSHEKSWNMKKWPEVMEFYKFCPQIVPNLYVFCHY